MECLTNLVGFDDCSVGVEPYKINHFLPANQLQELLHSGYTTVNNWVTATKKFASDRLIQDVLKAISPQVHMDTLLENGVAGRFNDNKIATTASSYAGIKIEYWDDRAYVKLRINKISFYGNYTGNIDFKVIDLMNGEELRSETVAVEAGKVSSKVVSIEVPVAMREADIAIVYDASAITSYKTTIAYNGCASCSNSRSVSRHATFSGVNLVSPFLLINGSSRNDTAGLSIEFSWLCDQAQWVCSISGALGLAMLYKTCYELLHSSLDSGSQFSNQQTTNYEQNVERMKSFEYNYIEELKKVITRVRIPDNKCFECNGRLAVRNRLPG